jgi:hypothetical protein
LAAGCRGKIELMLADDELAEDKLIASITGEAVKAVFEQYGKISELEGVIDAFTDKTTVIEIGDEVPTADLAASIERIPPLKKAAVKLCAAADQPFEKNAYLVAAAEFILEALYVGNRLSKYAYHGRTYFKR